jgi:hypothetical protein
MLLTTSYKDHRDEIQSGDLLVWSRDNLSPLSNAYLKIIRFATSSEYAHVGIAIRIFGRLFVLEATTPYIRLAPVSLKDEFYHIPMKIEWQNHYNDYLFSYIGCLYSIADAIRAYLGKTVKDDNRWQCVELAMDFYRKLGMDFGDNYTPTKFVKTVLEVTEKPIYFVKTE